MKKKIHPLSILFIIVGIAGIAFAGLCLYNQQIPAAIIVLGCSVVMFAFPSMLNTSAVSTDADSDDEPVEPVKTKSATKNKGSLLGTYNGRCRTLDKVASDCTLQVSTTRVDFMSVKGEKLFGMLRSSIKNVSMPNSHTVVLTVESGDYRFISNDANSVQHVYKLLNRPVQD